MKRPAHRPWGLKEALLLTWVFLAVLPSLTMGQLADEVIFRVAPVSTKHAEIARLTRECGLRAVRELRLRDGIVVARPTQGIAHTLAKLKLDRQVLWAAPHRRISLTDTLPNDPLFANQWHLRNTGQSDGTPGADIRACAAWDVTTGSRSVVIAITDTGTELTHPDLMGRFWVNEGEVPGNGIDDDGNGFVDDVHGWNFYANNNDVGPVLSHGTNVAGLAGAASNNATGVAAPNWNAPLMILSCFAPAGYATEADLAEAIAYACDNGARVINASWGSPGDSLVLREAVRYAREKGVFLSVAAGNYNFDADAHPFYPACFGYDNLLAVGGSTHRDEWIYNYGRSSVGLSAPAANLYFARYPSTYGTGSGTSYAAPLVTGVAALCLARMPSLDPLQLKFRLMGTADTPAGLVERNLTGGRLNAATALAVTDTQAPALISDLEIELVGASGAFVRWQAPADTGQTQCAFYQVKVAPPVDFANEPLMESVPTFLRPGPPGAEQWMLLNHLEPSATYRLALRALDSAGNAAPYAMRDILTPPSYHVFFDSCDTTAPVWSADGFELAGGDTHTGSLSWQDSPGRLYTSGTIATLSGGPFDTRGMTRPRLSFYLEHFFPNRFGEGDRLEVQASPDGGVTWKLLRKFRASLSPLRRITLPLDKLEASANLFIRFRLVADSNSFVDDGVYLDDIAITEGLGDVPFAQECIVESVDFFSETTSAPACVLNGSWVQNAGKSSAPRLEGAATLIVPAGTAGATARFVPFLPENGLYDVFVTHGYAANATQVTWRVYHQSGTDTLVRDQQSSEAHRWLYLGRFAMPYGRNPDFGAVELDASTATGVNASADAVRFELARPFLGPNAVSIWQQYE